MRLALALTLVILTTGSGLAGDKRVLNGVLGGIGAFSQGLADSMEAQRQADLARERLRLDQQRIDQELAYQRAVLEQNQRQFDALMKASTRWYLMIPHPERPTALDIRLWIHASSHDAADTCQRSKDETRRLLLAHARDVKAPPEATQTVMGVMNDARCIASNDPRLSKGVAP